jgi:hypothetical protein
MRAALAAAGLTKGLVALVFVAGAFAVFLPLQGELRAWRRLAPLQGGVLFLLLAAPWHILAGLRNRGGANGHGFFWFYFVNEHVLRFLGRRIPADYNKLPGALYWSLHLVWLFPWSFFAPVVAWAAWRRRGWLRAPHPGSSPPFRVQSCVLLGIFAGLVLVFFSLSTNQEYYTFPVYLPLLLPCAGVLARADERRAGAHLRRWMLTCQAALTIVAGVAAAAIGFGLWTSRHLPATRDLGDLLARRGIGEYTLSMSHFFDLTGPSFSALRLPAEMACATLLLGSLTALGLRLRGHGQAATLATALMSGLFLVSAHLALVRFGSLLSSADFAAEIDHLARTGTLEPGTEVLLFGDQALGSSIPFYLQRPVLLVDGRSTSMLFGSSFPDAPPIFLTPQQLLAEWGTGPRKLLFVPAERRADADHLLRGHRFLVYRNAGKELLTDRPPDPAVDRVQVQSRE